MQIIICQYNNFTTTTMFKNVTPREAYAAYILGSLFVDVRENIGADAKTVDVNQIITLPFSELDKRLGELPPNRPVVVVSNVGNRGREAAKLLQARGYADVANMEGGVAAWELEGLPVRTPA